MYDGHLFPYEMVDKGSNVILYGLGDMGKAYIEQINTTKYCNIIGVCDQKINSKEYKNYRLLELGKVDCDFYIIAIEDCLIASEIYYDFTSMGISEEKIVNVNMRYGKFPPESVGEHLKIVAFEGGGFGDTLLDMILLEKIKEIVPACEIIFYSRGYEAYFTPERFPFLTATKAYLDKMNRKDICKSADIGIFMHEITIIEKFCREKVRTVSKKLYFFCQDCIDTYMKDFNQSTNNYRFQMYALLLGKHRVEMSDLHNILGVSKDDKLSIPAIGKTEVLYRLGLQGVKYITINQEADKCQSTNHTKLWLTEHYIELCKMIRREFPDIKLVLVGGSDNEELASCIDIDLSGKTTLLDMDAIVGNAVLHIGGEGGLIHLRHFLNGGPSVVLFGPTDPRILGYDENINLVNRTCPEHCYWITHTWAEKCARGYDSPLCMQVLSPCDVFDAVKGALEGVR